MLCAYSIWRVLMCVSSHSYQSSPDIKNTWEIIRFVLLSEFLKLDSPNTNLFILSEMRGALAHTRGDIQ